VGGGDTTVGCIIPAAAVAFAASSWRRCAAASFSLYSVVHTIASSSFLCFSASFEHVGILGVNEGGIWLVTVTVRAMGC
jgi:hypothetical protein